MSLDEGCSEEHTEMCCGSRPHLVLQHYILHSVHGQPSNCRVSVFVNQEAIQLESIATRSPTTQWFENHFSTSGSRTPHNVISNRIDFLFMKSGTFRRFDLSRASHSRTRRHIWNRRRKAGVSLFRATYYKVSDFNQRMNEWKKRANHYFNFSIQTDTTRHKAIAVDPLPNTQ